MQWRALWPAAGSQLLLFHNMYECLASMQLCFPTRFFFFLPFLLRTLWRIADRNTHFFSAGFDAGEAELTVQLQGPFANDF